MSDHNQSKRGALLAALLVALPAGVLISSVNAAAAPPPLVANFFQAANVGYRFSASGEVGSSNVGSSRTFDIEEFTDADGILDGTVLPSANGWLIKGVSIANAPVEAASLSDASGFGLVESILPTQLVTTTYDFYANPDVESLDAVGGIQMAFWYDGRLVDPTVKTKGPFQNFDVRKMGIMEFCGVEKHFIDLSGILGLKMDAAIAQLLFLPILVPMNPHNSPLCTVYTEYILPSASIPLASAFANNGEGIGFTADDGSRRVFNYVMSPADFGNFALSESEAQSLADSIIARAAATGGAIGPTGGRLGHLLYGLLFNPHYAFKYGDTCTVAAVNTAVEKSAQFLALELDTPGAGNCLRVLHVIGTHGTGMPNPARIAAIDWKAVTGAKFGMTEIFSEVLAVYDVCNEDFEVAEVACAQSYLQCSTFVDTACTVGGVLAARNVIQFRWNSPMADVDFSGTFTEADKKLLLDVAIGDLKNVYFLHKAKHAQEHFFGLCTWTRYEVDLLLALSGVGTPASGISAQLLWFGIAIVDSYDITILNHWLAFPSKQWRLSFVHAHEDLQAFPVPGIPDEGIPNIIEIGYTDAPCIAGLDFFEPFVLLAA